jgi:hypothetical protein
VFNITNPIEVPHGRHYFFIVVGLSAQTPNRTNISFSIAGFSYENGQILTCNEINRCSPGSSVMVSFSNIHTTGTGTFTSQFILTGDYSSSDNTYLLRQNELGLL